MLRDAEPCEDVMERFAAVARGANLVAHNASFDRRFLEAVFGRLGRQPDGDLACSMLAARRLCPEAPNHRLGTLVAHLELPTEGTFHRALADAEMTAALWLRLLDLLAERASPGGLLRHGAALSDEQSGPRQAGRSALPRLGAGSRELGRGPQAQA